jgi:hypothetical protein
MLVESFPISKKQNHPYKLNKPQHEIEDIFYNEFEQIAYLADLNHHIIRLGMAHTGKHIAIFDFGF